MSAIDWLTADQIRGAVRLMHASILWSERPQALPPRGVVQRPCADCDRMIAVTQRVFDERQRAARAHDRELELVCHDCAFAFVDAQPDDVPLVAVMPTPEERDS